MQPNATQFPRAVQDDLQRELARLNHLRLTPARPTDDWRATLDDELALRRRELAFLEAKRAEVAPLAARAPDRPDAFVRWFEDLRITGPGQGDPLFPWLAHEATRHQLAWFLHQEIGGEAGFDDLVALAQLKLPDRPKLELARNYWDEMGCGTEKGMHGPMLARLATAPDLVAELATCGEVVVESLALGNTLAGLAANRRYAYHALGALGVVELTAPGRAALVNAGMKRLGLAGHARQYYALHATLDVRHSEAWNREVLAPLVAAQPAVARDLAEGALMRLAAGAACFERYRRELGVPGHAAGDSVRRVAAVRAKTAA